MDFGKGLKAFSTVEVNCDPGAIGLFRVLALSLGHFFHFVRRALRQVFQAILFLPVTAWVTNGSKTVYLHSREYTSISNLGKIHLLSVVSLL